MLCMPILSYECSLFVLLLCFENTAGYNQPPSSMSTMRRDYYRGSQDSLADRAGLYRGTF